MTYDSELLPDRCPYCDTKQMRLDTERDGTFTITCYNWCGIGSPRYKTKELVFQWFKNKKKYIAKKGTW